jgi:hypothetical protein
VCVLQLAVTHTANNVGSRVYGGHVQILGGIVSK